MRTFRATFLLAGLGIGPAGAQTAGGDPAAELVVFGDSLSDTGNSYVLTADIQGVDQRPPFPWYTLGRYTNGPDNTAVSRIHTTQCRAEGMWVEQLADILDIERPHNSLSGGRNYAYAGASTESSSFGPGGLNVGAQVRAYLQTPLADPAQGRFVVLAGANDIVNATLTPGATRASILAAASRAVANLHAGITALASALAPGQRITVIWANVPPFDRSPFGQQLPASLRDAMAEAIVQFRDQHRVAVADLAHHPGLRVLALDLHALFGAVLAGTATWLPQDVTNNVIVAGNLGANRLRTQRNPAVPNGIDPDDWLWWDELHFTARMHQLVAETAAALLDSLAPTDAARPVPPMPLMKVSRP